MRLAAPLVTLVMVAALLGGCGSSGGSTSTGGGAPPPKAGTAKAPVGASTKSCALDAGVAGGLRATGVSCGEAQKVALAWQRTPACSAHAGASRSACTVGRYRCLAASTDRGLAVSCARPGQAIAFIDKRD